MRNIHSQFSHRVGVELAHRKVQVEVHTVLLAFSTLEIHLTFKCHSSVTNPLAINHNIYISHLINAREPAKHKQIDYTVQANKTV